MIDRIVIDSVRPATLTRTYPAKAVVGETVVVSADIFREGHDILSARVRWRKAGGRRWVSSSLTHAGNDRWVGSIVPSEIGLYEFVVEAWTGRYASWRHDVLIKKEFGDDVSLELEEGARILEAMTPLRKSVSRAVAKLRENALSFNERLRGALSDDVAAFAISKPGKDLSASPRMQLWVDRPAAMFGAWYEFFPRSEGGFREAIKRLHAVAEMGFDVVYLPPIHPIGLTARKGPNNSVDTLPGDPGSPWAIGSHEGGHTAIHKDLGTFEDFADFLEEASSLGLEVALDYALQCSPDHPWVRDHPEWFNRRPDGTIKYAENPPKKYQDIYPINFWPDKGREELWDACRDVMRFWIERGVRIFRVDNPHTKPLRFWEWMLGEIRQEYPDVIFLSEAFTRPKMMAKLAEVGFSQSYTYFTWRNAKWELTEYLSELALGPKSDYMRPNFWTNTPDILSGPLRNGPPSAFRLRLVLAATMVPSYGMYSGYEIFENAPLSEHNEEYLDSEKYEIKSRDWSRSDSLAPFLRKINSIRRRHEAFKWLTNVTFHHSDDERVIVFSKRTGDDVMLMVVNLDPMETAQTRLWLDLDALSVSENESFEAYDELTDELFEWEGNAQYVKLDPKVAPAHILRITSRTRRVLEDEGEAEDKSRERRANPDIWKG